jgi:SAM-dependent methyltransferase
MSRQLQGIKSHPLMIRTRRLWDGSRAGDLAYSTEQNNPSVRAFIERCVRVPANFNANIYKEDEVYLHGLDRLKNKDLALMLYFKYGAEIMNEIRQIVTWKFNGFSDMAGFLDFACGYGRVTRFLSQELLPERIWVSDIYAKAVQFQQAQFGVNGFVSVTEPEDLICEQKFDFIFVASLFSHLPEHRFGKWLSKLHSLLTPSGLLAFSVHDEYILLNQTIPDGGHRFLPDSESKYLASGEYGSMFVTEGFVRDTFQQAIGSNWSYLRLRRGLCGYQDIYVIGANPQEDFSALDFRLGPEGHLDSCKLLSTGDVQLQGWAGEPKAGRAIDEVRVLVNGQVVQRCQPTLPRPDVVAVLCEPKYANAGWECSFSAGQAVAQPIDKVLEVHAVSDDGVSTILHLSTLKAAVGQRLS